MSPSKTVAAITALLAISGCQSLNLGAIQWPSFDVPSLNLDKLSLSRLTSKLRSQSPEDDFDDEFETKVDTPLVGEYAVVAGLNLITLEGVGLVTGLDGTGGDPPPSMHRTRLLDEMRKRGVRSPNRILQLPSTALVVVRAYLPPLVRKGEHFDVEVRLPGESGATSLNGGWLMESYLSEHAMVPGQGVMKGHLFAKAAGPILISTGEGDEDSLAGVLRRGRILGGGVSLKERNLALYLRNDFRSVRNSRRIADRVGRRFFQYNRHGIREPVAEAKNDQKIELKVLERYRDNFPRYLQVIRHIAFRETEVARRVRVQKLKAQLNNSAKAERAAMALEAIGPDTIPVLKSALKNRSLEAQFHAAVALAYLGEADGTDVLAEAARNEPAFRVFAMAALAALDDAESRLALRELLHESSAETRYGAFRALTTAGSNDPFVRGEKLNDQFMFHVLNTEGDPMIHLTHRRKAELVLFGAGQRFHTPLAVRAGNHILITAEAGSDTVKVSRYQVGQSDRTKTVSTRIADVIGAAAALDATYPDLAQMLVQAERQQNLPGRLELDAMPQAGRVYYRPQDSIESGSDTTAQVGRSTLIPNLFATHKDSDPTPKPPAAPTEDDDTGTASLTDARELDAELYSRRPARKWYDLSRLFERSPVKPPWSAAEP